MHLRREKCRNAPQNKFCGEPQRDTKCLLRKRKGSLRSDHPCTSEASFAPFRLTESDGGKGDWVFRLKGEKTGDFGQKTPIEDFEIHHSASLRSAQSSLLCPLISFAKGCKGASAPKRTKSPSRFASANSFTFFISSRPLSGAFTSISFSHLRCISH